MCGIGVGVVGEYDLEERWIVERRTLVTVAGIGTVLHTATEVRRPGLLADRLAGAEVGEEIAKLLGVEGRSQALGHEGLTEGLELLDFVAAEGEVLAVEAPEDDDVIVLVGEETIKDSAVLGGEGEVFKAFADFGAGVDEAG